MTDATYATVMDGVFAMDAYEHDPGANAPWSRDLKQFFPDLVNGQLGGYAVADESTQTEQDSNDFFAIAYTSSSGSIISYRGTTNEVLTDAANGYGIAFGSPYGNDAADAVGFYRDVANLLNDPWQGAPDITVVGHSLGGGLAGFVGAIYGLQGVLFDNMPFNLAAAHAFEDTVLIEGNRDRSTQIRADLRAAIYGSQSPYPNKLSGLSAYQVAGQFLEGPTLSQTPTVQSLSAHAGPRDPFNQLHDIGLLTLLLYADVKAGTAWQSIGIPLFNALFNDSLATAIVGSASGTAFNATQMRTIIAYSAINAGYEPFGTTALQSLFTDADTLGGIQSAGQFTGLLAPDPVVPGSATFNGLGVDVTLGVSPVAALAEIAVQFAGDQAAAANTDTSLAQGAFELDGTTLKVDLDPTEWTSTFQQAAHSSATTTAVVGLGDFFDGVLANISAGVSAADPTYSWIASNAAGFSPPLLKQLNEITEVDIALAGGDLSAAGTLPAAYDGTAGGAMLVGGQGEGSITGSTNGNDIIIGGANVTTGNGKDIILAGGSETLTLGTGKNLILADSSSLNATLTYAGGAVGAPGGPGSGGESGGPPPAIASKGTDVIIGNSAGGDTFTFTDAERAAFTVVWGGSGNDTFNINTSSSSNVNVVELDMSGISGGNLTNLDATALETDVDKKYGLSSNDATIVILNPSASDTISYNGKTVSTPASTLSGTSWDYDVDGSYDVPNAVRISPLWTVIGSDSGSSHVLASANFEFGYGSTNASTRELSLQPIVQNVITSSGVSFNLQESLSGIVDGFQRFAEGSTSYLSTTSGGTLNLINYNPGDFGIGLPENGTALEGIQKETEYDKSGAVLSNDTKQVAPNNLYDPSLADPSFNRPTINLADFLSGTSATDPTGVSTAFFAANQGLLDGQFYGFTVLDASTNVSSALDALNADSKLTGITLTDSGTPTLTLTISQASNDAAALGEITNASYDIAIADTSANVSQVIDALNADTTVTSIHLTDAGTPSLTLTAMQALQDTAALAKISNASYAIAISDTAADVAFGIDALNGDAAVDSITLTDSGTLTLTVAQALGDTRALGEITNATYGITIEDTAANIMANASALTSDGHVTGAIVVDTANNVLNNSAALNANAQVTSITVVDTAANILANLSALQADSKVTSLVVADTAANVLANASALAGISEISSIGVVDSATNMSANIDALNADSSVGWVELTDSATPALTLTAIQAVNDASLLAKIASPYAIDVADTAAAIAENIDALAKIATLANVALTDTGTPILTLTAAQAVNDAGVIAMISNTNAEIVISDTEANVAAQLDALNTDSKITAITLTDSGTPTLTLTVAQLLNDATTLGKIDNSNVRIVVSDTAADVSANCDALNADAALSSITLTDRNMPTLILTAAQAAGDTALLAKISNSNYAIAIFDSVSNILVDAGSLTSNGKVSSITAIDTVANILGNSAGLVSAGSTSQLISDTAANVAANIDAIKADTSIRAISLTDSGTPTLSLTVAQTIDDAAVLAMIVNSTLAIDVSGTATDISANINFLAANSLIGAVTLTDAGVPTLSLNAGEAAGDTAFLAKITNANYVVDVADTAAEVSANLDALNSNAAIGAITLTDTGTPVLYLSVVQALDDTSALGLVTNANYTIAITDTAVNVVTNTAALAGDAHVSSISVVDNAANVLAADGSLASNPLLGSITVTDTAANVVANESALAGISGVTAIDVVDTAAGISANFDALNGDSSISEITLSDANPVLTLTAEQAANDYSVFNAITNSSYSIAVVDTAADVTQYLGQLAYNQNLTSITLTDSGTPTLDFYSYELGSGVLSKITNADYTVSVLDSSAVSVSTFVTDQAVLDASPGGFSISDTAADVSTQIDALSGDTHLTSIALTDWETRSLALSGAQFVNDDQALGKITNSDYTIAVTDTAAHILAGSETFAGSAHITSLVVQDTAANVLANAAALGSDGGITSIVIVDTAANVLADKSALDALTVPLTIEVEESAADVSALIDQLAADTSLSTVTLTDTTNPTLTLTVGQAINDLDALSKIAGPSPYVPATYGIAIVDTAANVSQNIDVLRNITQISSISLTDSQQLSLSLDVTDALADQGVLGTLSNGTYSVGVVDTAANIETNIDGLSFDPNISSITVQDANVINVTSEQAAQGAAVLGKIVNATVNVVNTTNISVAEFLSEQSAIDSIPANFSIFDSAANVSTVLASLNADLNLAAITLSDGGVPTLSLTAAQFLQSTVALGEITNPSYAVAVTDTAATIGADFAALNDMPQISSITLSDPATGIPLTVAELAIAAPLLAKVTNGTGGIAIVDTSFRIADDIDALNTDPRVTSITINGGGNMGLTVAQALGDTTALDEITGSYTVAIDDSAANVAAQFDPLNSDRNVASITLTDSGVPTLVLTATQVQNDATALGKITNATYKLDIVGTGSETINIGQTLQPSNFAYDSANADWQVSGSGLAETLSNVAAVVDGSGHRFLLVGGGSQYATIQEAVNAASNGDTILIAPGNYTENVSITGKAISLEGFGGTTLHGSIAESGTLNGALSIDGISIDATGQQYGVLVSANSTNFVGSVAINNSSIANAELNGFAYIENGNGSTPTHTDTIGSIAILNSTFSGNATQTSGANGRGDILLYGYNQDFTVSGVTIQNPGAGAQKAIQVRGVQTSANTVDVGPYQPSGNISLTDLTVSGSYTQDLLAFYRFADLGSFSTSGVTLNAAAPWGLLNFDEVGGTVDLSSGISVTNLAAGAPVGVEQGLNSNSTFVGAGGSDVFVSNGGNDTLIGGTGNNTYVVSAMTSQATIDASGTAGATNALDFVGGITDEKLWFQQSGNDLKIDLVGTHTQVDISGWFSSSSNQLQEITAGGLKIDGQVSQLVQAMATYSANNSGFDPTASGVTTVPNDANLQTALAAAWHS